MTPLQKKILKDAWSFFPFASFLNILDQMKESLVQNYESSQKNEMPFLYVLISILNNDVYFCRSLVSFLMSSRRGVLMFPSNYCLSDFFDSLWDIDKNCLFCFFFEYVTIASAVYTYSTNMFCALSTISFLSYWSWEAVRQFSRFFYFMLEFLLVFTFLVEYLALSPLSLCTIRMRFLHLNPVVYIVEYMNWPSSRVQFSQIIFEPFDRLNPVFVWFCLIYSVRIHFSETRFSTTDLCCLL